MIHCSLVQNDQWCQFLGAVSQPNYYFLGKLSLLLNTTSFVGAPDDLQPIFDDFEHCTCHQNQKFFPSEKRIVKVSSFRKLCRTQFANFILLLFSKSVRAGSTLFLYEQYLRSCFKILKTDPREISSSPSFRLDTVFFPCHSFFHLLDHSFGPNNAWTSQRVG